MNNEKSYHKNGQSKNNVNKFYFTNPTHFIEFFFNNTFMIGSDKFPLFKSELNKSFNFQKKLDSIVIESFFQTK